MYSDLEYQEAVRRYNNLYRRNSAYISRKNVGLLFIPGWFSIIEQLFQYIADSGCTDVIVQKIQERMAYLSIFYVGGDDILYTKIVNLEKSAIKICYACGKPGTRCLLDGKVTTRCEEHSADYIPKDHTTIVDKNLIREFTNFSKKFNLDP